MGYRSVVGFSLTGQLEPVLDLLFDLRKQSGYISDYQIHYSSVLYNSIAQKDFLNQEFLEAFQITQFDYKKNNSQYSLVFYHNYMKWYEDVHAFYQKLTEKYSLLPSFSRQGETLDDFVMEIQSQNPLMLKKYFQIKPFTKENGREICLKSFDSITPYVENKKDAFAPHMHFLNPKFLEFVQEKVFNKLSNEEKLLKAISWGMSDWVKEILPNIDKSILKNLEPKINETLKVELAEHYKKSTSKKYYIDMLKELNNHYVVLNEELLNFKVIKEFNSFEQNLSDDENFKLKNSIEENKNFKILKL